MKLSEYALGQDVEFCTGSGTPRECWRPGKVTRISRWLAIDSSGKSRCEHLELSVTEGYLYLGEHRYGIGGATICKGGEALIRLPAGDLL